METKRNRKLVCLVISLLMVLTLLPSAIFADTASADKPVPTGTAGVDVIKLEVNGQDADVETTESAYTYKVNEEFSFGDKIKFTFTGGGAWKHNKYDIKLVAPDGSTAGAACVVGSGTYAGDEKEDEAGYLKANSNADNAILDLTINKPEAGDVQYGTYTLVIMAGSASRRTELTNDVNFNIAICKKISECSVSMNDKFEYTGEAIEPEVTVTAGDGTVLVKDKDYITEYENNIGGGTATVKIKGIGAYDGTIKKTFEIIRPLSSGLKISLPSDVLIYNGNEKEPMVTVKDTAGNRLKMNIDFEVEYINNIKCGTATARITGINNYSGTVTKTFSIRPAKASVTRVTPGARKFTVTAKSQKASGVTGYQVAYKLSTGKTYKTVRTTSNVKTLKSLKKGKKYYVKVRAYKKVSGSKYLYGSYSSVKSVRVK